MPIYEYVCRECGKELERLQKLADEPLTDCPECSAPALKRKVSAAGFRLAGGGWYETDFKSDGQRNLAGEKGGNDSKGKESQSGSTDSDKASAGTKEKGKQSDSAGST